MPHPDFLSSAVLINGNALIEAPKLTPNSAVQKDSKSYSSSVSIFSLGQCKILNHLKLVMCHFSNTLSSICYKLLVLISSLKVCRGREFLVAWFFFSLSFLCVSREELPSVQLLNSMIWPDWCWRVIVLENFTCGGIAMLPGRKQKKWCLQAKCVCVCNFDFKESFIHSFIKYSSSCL